MFTVKTPWLGVLIALQLVILSILITNRSHRVERDAKEAARDALMCARFHDCPSSVMPATVGSTKLANVGNDKLRTAQSIEPLSFDGGPNCRRIGLFQRCF
jgi:hypothetical protein